ncbi:MAG: hypothetical protein KDK99_02675, partial [Verrucomicrobiales bacterium]|nr:hypothetical protein [Verrucomicrobiales bacterium]
MAKSRKTLTQLIHPGREVWESRRLFGGDTAAEADEPVTPGEARFAKAAQRRVLVLPVSHAWVMPAWLKGDPAFLKDMAALHLERLGIRVEDPSHGMLLKQVAEKEDAHLTAILTLKDESSPLAAQSPLPH